MSGAAELHSGHFGSAPTFTVRSPGRINLIGDHTDYCGLPVLPMAIGRAVFVSASDRRDSGVVAVTSLAEGVVDTASGRSPPPWGKYVVAVVDQLQPLAPLCGARIAIDGDLPATGGLASSSALTVGCLVALNRLWKLDVSSAGLVAMAVAAERTAAIAGGAMDQTVIAYARRGHALRIDFDPPQLSHVPVPDEFRWIASYSGSPAAKGGSASHSYNSFVLAARAAARLLGDTAPSTPSLSRVRHASSADLSALGTMTAPEAADITGGDDLGLPDDLRLDLAMSAGHVLAEATRVDGAEQALRDADMPAFGRLMNESHGSLRRYGSSTPALDALVAAAGSAGAFGARVTGAGFGGWAIALASPSRASAVAAAMEAACGGPAFHATAEAGALED